MAIDIKVKFLLNKQTKEETYSFIKEKEIVIGRYKDNHISLKEGHVSGRHAKILRRNDKYFLMDNKSSNGTLLNNKSIEPLKEYELKSGDKIKIINFELEVQIKPDPPPPPQEIKKQEEKKKKKEEKLKKLKVKEKLFNSLKILEEEKPWLVVIEGADKGKQIKFKEIGQKIVIGRSKDCDFVLVHKSISKRHALIHWGLTGVTIKDLGSLNKTYVNDKEVTSTPVHLKDQDIIVLGLEKLMFINPLKTSISEETEKKEVKKETKKKEIEKKEEVKKGKEEKIEKKEKDEQKQDQKVKEQKTQDKEVKATPEASKKVEAKEKPKSKTEEKEKKKKKQEVEKKQKTKEEDKNKEGKEKEKSKSKPSKSAKAKKGIPILLVYIIWVFAGIITIGSIILLIFVMMK